MAEKKKIAAEAKKRVLRTHRWDPDLIEATAAYIADQEVPPTEIATFETAIRKFLEDRGFWPPRRKAD